jgi:hypothetical protein
MKERGKFTGKFGKAWDDMDNEEKLAEVRKRGKIQQLYVEGIGGDRMYTLGGSSKESKAYLNRLKKLYIELKEVCKGV